MKLLLRLLGAASALALVGIAAFFIYFDAVAGRAIEAGASEALGVETHVGWVRIRLLAGEFQLARLSVDNPTGYESEHFLKLDSARFEVEPRSLREAVVVVPRFELDGVEVVLEKTGGRSNYDAILSHLRSFTGGGSPPESGAGGGGKRLIVGELVIRDVTAQFDLAVPGRADRARLQIPEIRLRDLGGQGSRGASIAQISRTVVQAVLTAVARQAPVELSSSLLRGLRGLGRLPLEIDALADRSLAEGVGEAVGGLGRAAAGAVGGAARSTREALGRIGGALSPDGEE